MVLLYDRVGSIYIGVYQGLYRSTDDGATWLPEYQYPGPEILHTLGLVRSGEWLLCAVSVNAGEILRKHVP